MTIASFSYDDENEEKFASHGLTPWQVDQVLDDTFIVVPNRKSRRALYLVIGHDHGGTCLAIPIQRTHDPTVWRPVTAWRCKDHEQARLDERSQYDGGERDPGSPEPGELGL